jgi:hypothetical protein
MDSAGPKQVERRLRRRSTCLVALAVVSTLGVAYAVSARTARPRHSVAVAAEPLSVLAAPPTRTVAPGFPARFAVRVMRTRSGSTSLSGRTELSVGHQLPAGARASFAPIGSIASPADPGHPSSLTVTTATNTPPGTYQIRIRARRPNRSGSTTISLIVVTRGGPVPAPIPNSSPAPAPPLSTPDAFTISGTVPDLLTPGAAAPLDLTLSNREGSEIRISSLSVRVASVSGPQTDPTHPCSANDFSVEQFSGTPGFTLAASSSASLDELGFDASEWPEVSMLNLPVNQDGCKQASLTLEFAGTATAGTQ